MYKKGHGCPLKVADWNHLSASLKHSNETLWQLLKSLLPSFHCEGGKVIFFQHADVLKAPQQRLRQMCGHEGTIKRHQSKTLVNDTLFEGLMRHLTICSVSPHSKRLNNSKILCDIYSLGVLGENHQFFYFYYI